MAESAKSRAEIAQLQGPMPHVHVAIIGGGPAGAAAALTLARAGARAALIERAPRMEWKCGEGLPPHAKPLLQRLGVWERFLAEGHCPSYGNRSAWGAEQAVERHFLFGSHGVGWHLDRARFDGMLAAAAADAGAAHWQGCRVVAAQPRAQGGWLLDLQMETGQAYQAQADAVIDASGRSSWFARSQGVRRLAQDRLIGLAVLMTPTRPGAEQDTFTLVEAAPDGWWYSALLEAGGAEGRMVVAYMTDADLPTPAARAPDDWNRLLAQTTHTAARLRPGGYAPLARPRVLSANSSPLQRIIGEGWLAVGDAAFGHDPLSSQGILTALTTGMEAAQALVGLLCGRSDALRECVERAESGYARYLHKRAGYYAMERRWPDSPFWNRGQYKNIK